MKKDLKLKPVRKPIATEPEPAEPGKQPTATQPEPEPTVRIETPIRTDQVKTATVRKTVELPEDYFWKVKRLALDRKCLEKDIWGEIVREYFYNHSL